MHRANYETFKRCRAGRCEDVNMDPRESDTQHKTRLSSDELKQVSGPLLTVKHVSEYLNTLILRS